MTAEPSNEELAMRLAKILTGTLLGRRDLTHEEYDAVRLAAERLRRVPAVRHMEPRMEESVKKKCSDGSCTSYRTMDGGCPVCGEPCL